jgi:signal transduction histidine kinase
MAEMAESSVSKVRPKLWRRCIALSSAWLGSTALTSAALAQAATDLRLSPPLRGTFPMVMDMSAQLSLITFGVTIVAAVVSVLHIVERQNWNNRQALQDERFSALQARLQQADTFMAGEQQVVLSWTAAESDPDYSGDLTLIGPGKTISDVLAFERWLAKPDSDRLRQLSDKLKLRGEAFVLSVDNLAGKRLEIDGRAVAGRAVMRIRNVDGDRLERIKAEESYGRLAGEMAALHAVLDALPQPLWLRYPDGRLAWVNRAYAEAVDSRHPNDVVAKGTELIEAKHRAELQPTETDEAREGRLPVIMAGKRSILDVFERKTPFGSGGIAIDVLEVDELGQKLDAQLAMQARILNAIPIAFAAFDSRQSLRFHNAAYEKLWGLDPAFLAGRPTDSELLDKLRGHRRLPEQADFRTWKQGLLASYQASEAATHLWHLPGGRVLNVRVEPSADGGVSYLYEDLTAAYRLEAEFKALTKVQSETLDSLKEGVAVFGSDGRLKLANTAFLTIWGMDAELLAGAPHIDSLMAQLGLSSSDALWTVIRESVVSMSDRREAIGTKQTRQDGTVLECGMQPLSDGALLVTFADVTSEQRNADLMVERNEALETASRVKNEFIKNVSGEIKTPLQTVVLSVGMLADGTMGSLTPRQKEYASVALKSADTMMSLMTRIFDLASLDAGALELNVQPTDPRAEIASVLEALSDRIQNQRVVVAADLPATLGTFEADPSRVRQVLYHVIGNAVAFSPEGETVTVRTQIKDDMLVFAVIDRGRGIPEAAQQRIFERFERNADDSEHRGVGLGLSMVKALMELHGGTVSLESAEGKGTTVFCNFPLKQTAKAAEKIDHERVA